MLSNDVQYLFKIFKLVKTGSKVCHPKTNDNPLGGLESLRFANPGSLHHARWVTLCNRVLRYYVSQASPSKELKRVVTFAVRVYIPGWFLTIKKGPFLLHTVVANLQSLAEEDFFDTVEKYWHPKDAKKKKNRRVVSELGLMQNCLSENAYFAHEEGILISMLCDQDRPEYRKKAAETIIKIRGLRQEGAGLRNFVTPVVTWETATSYDKFILDTHFEDPRNLNEPPLTMRWADQEV